MMYKVPMPTGTNFVSPVEMLNSLLFVHRSDRLSSDRLPAGGHYHVREALDACYAARDTVKTPRKAPK
jgi:hypothetical protein